MGQMILADLDLSRRLERAEGQSSAEFVEARAALFPERGVRWIEVAGAHVMYDGPQSPITQTFGLGMSAPVTVAEMETIEQFYAEHGAPVFHEVSPLADAGLFALLNERRYQPIEFTNVMFRPLEPDLRLGRSVDDRVQVRLIRDDERALWAQTSAAGWSEFTEYADQMLELAQVGAHRPGALSFLAELDGQAIATGALNVVNGVALLAGASTIPQGRKHGAQLALLEARLRHAAAHDCDIAMICAQPGSASQRNAERQGFRIAYTRIKWKKC